MLPQAKAKRNYFSFILFQKDKAPEFYKLSSGSIKRLFLTLPIITLIAIAIIFGFIYYFAELKAKSEAQVPIIVKTLNNQIENLKRELQEQKSFSSSLETKLANPVVNENIKESWPFLPPQGSELKIASEVLTSERFIAEQLPEGLKVKFNLVNQTNENNRISGYLFVILKTPDSLKFFPAEVFQENNFDLLFTRGESFVTSRFRPVEAFFSGVQNLKTFQVKLIIFSRVGDLIHKKILTYPGDFEI